MANKKKGQGTRPGLKHDIEQAEPSVTQVAADRVLSAKALIADALIFCEMNWTASQIKTAFTLAEYMFGVKRDAHVGQDTIARKRHCNVTRVREALQVLCRRPDEPHDSSRHAFIRTYRCIPWEDGRRGGRKASIFHLAPEFEQMVLQARRTETPENQAFRSATETPDFRDRNAGVAATETCPRGPSESGIESGNESGFDGLPFTKNQTDTHSGAQRTAPARWPILDALQRHAGQQLRLSLYYDLRIDCPNCRKHTLDVRLGENGAVVLCCHGGGTEPENGCLNEEIVAMLGCVMADLYQRKEDDPMHKQTEAR